MSIQSVISDRPSYRFTFQITDQTSGETVIADWLTLDADGIDQFGGNEAVDHGVARMLRAFRQTVRDRYEFDNYDAAAMGME